MSKDYYNWDHLFPPPVLDRAIANSPIQCPDLDQEPPCSDEENYCRKVRQAMEDWMGGEEEVHKIRLAMEDWWGDEGELHVAGFNIVEEDLSITPHMFAEYREDAVHKPDHYKGGFSIETIEVIEGFGLNYNLGNVVKYVTRHEKKGGLEDLRKALNYLHREIYGTWFNKEG